MVAISGVETIQRRSDAVRRMEKLGRVVAIYAEAVWIPAAREAMSIHRSIAETRPQDYRPARATLRIPSADDRMAARRSITCSGGGGFPSPK